MINYRIPYLGSKQKLAQKLIDEMRKQKPQAKYFIDLFGGGGAMSFKALQNGFKVIYNEKRTYLPDLIKYLLNAKQNKYGCFPDYFYDFVDREKYKKIISKKYEDCKTMEEKIYRSFVSVCYSFSNNEKSYIYNKNIVQTKKKNMILFFLINKIMIF